VRLGRLLRRGGRGQDLRRQGQHRRFDRRAHGQLRRGRADGKAGRRAAADHCRQETRRCWIRSCPKSRRTSRSRWTLITEIHNQFIAAVKEGRGKRLKETPDMFSGLIWSGAKSVELGLTDAIGGLDYVAREVIRRRTSSTTRRRKTWRRNSRAASVPAPWLRCSSSRRKPALRSAEQQEHGRALAHWMLILAPFFYRLRRDRFGFSRQVSRKA